MTNLWLIPATPLAFSLIILTLANSRRTGAAALAIAGQIIAFWRFSPEPQQPTGVMVAIFSIAIAAAEAAVGLALVIAIYRHYRTTNVDQLDQLKG